MSADRLQGATHGGELAEMAQLQLPPRHPAAAAVEVAPRVLGQVVAAHEAALAHSAGEPLLPRVRAAVAGQLVRAGKMPPAALPATAEWLLTWQQKK